MIQLIVDNKWKSNNNMKTTNKSACSAVPSGPGGGRAVWRVRHAGGGHVRGRAER